MDFLTELFPVQQTAAEVEAGLAAAQAVESARLARVGADAADRAELAARLRCGRCAGTGFLSQFQHRKGGECFACGGSGVRA